MAKFYGVIGYAEPVETEPGVWKDEITEIMYYGDMVRNVHKIQNSGGVNDNITISDSISIISDPYAMTHSQFMKYVEFMGAKWKITDIEVRYPRIILSVGGVYNGEQA